MIRKAVTVLAWASLLAIAMATLSPIELRPHLGAVGFERFWAFAVVGLLFSLAYPRRLWLVVSLVGGAAVGLELLQHLTPDRHGRIPDALVKVAGSLAGVGLAFVIEKLLGKICDATPQPRALD